MRPGRQPQARPVGGKACLILLPPLPLGDEPLLAQEATGLSREAREEEELIEAQLADPLRRGEAVAILDPALRREILQIDPAGGRALLGHALDEAGGQFAGKGFYDHPGRDGIRWQGALPALDVYALNPLAILRGIQPRTDTGEARQIVHPEPHLSMPLPLELAGQPPGDANVAEVVHHGAEDVPVEGGQGACHGSGFQMQKNRCAG
ncbi:hypothetical protein D3C78_1229770 [compost metagenome]